MMKTAPSPGNILASVFLMIVFFGLVYLLIYGAQPTARHVPAEPYEWSWGCKEVVSIDAVGHRFYKEEMPRACMDPKYYIADPAKYGLHKILVVRNYYRVGSDAVNVRCYGDRRCVVDHVERDVFAESGERHE